MTVLVISIKQNVSSYDKITCYMHYIKFKLIKLLQYRRTYRNYLDVIIHIIRKKYPVEAVLRDKSNRTVTLHDHFEAYNIVKLDSHKEIEYDPLENLVTVSSTCSTTDSKSKVKLYGAISNGEVTDIFINNIYKYLPVEGNIVIDIGANIGDSSIYFALCGASKVIGVEPFPSNYKLAKKNIELNNLSNKITLVLAGCGAKTGFTTIDPDLQSISESAKGFKDGVKVPLITLEKILNENNISSSNATVVLKMDCEGCENDVILSCDESTLRRFSHIQIEYHFGYKNLKEKLEKCGFSVSVTTPQTFIMLGFNVPSYYIGNIYAGRN